MRILVCGVGTLGGNLVEHLARTSHDQLVVLDHDKVERHNLKNQPYFQHQIGKSKVAALAENVFRIAGQKLDTHHKRLTAQNAGGFLEGVELVVDCFDNHQARADLQRACRSHSMSLVHLGLASDYGEVVWDERYQVPPDVERDPCAEPLSRRLALQAVVLFEKARLEGKSLCFTAGDLAVNCLG